jgi:Flp pilus assembly protein TadG
MRSHSQNLQVGQSIIEVAFIIVLFPLFLAAVFDLGGVFHASIVITNAAEEGARYLSSNPHDKEDDFEGTLEAAQREASSSSVPLDLGEISVTLCTDTADPVGCDSGTAVEITVTKSVSFITSFIFSEPLSLSSSARMYVP